MKRRKWSSEQKLKIVLEGLSGQIEISKLCNKYPISQPLYYLNGESNYSTLVTRPLRRKTLPRKKKGYKTKIQQLKQINHKAFYPNHIW